MSELAVVRLAPGQVGYFDELTRIHLTIKNPEKKVLTGMNTDNLKRAVRSGRILLVSGSLTAPETNVQQKEVEVIPAAQTVQKVEVDEMITGESVKVEENPVIIEEVKVETAEEAVTEIKVEAIEEVVPEIKEPAVEVAEAVEAENAPTGEVEEVKRTARRTRRVNK